MGLYQCCSNCESFNYIKTIHHKREKDSINFFAICGKCNKSIPICTAFDAGLAELFAYNLQFRLEVEVEFLHGDPIGLPGTPGPSEDGTGLIYNAL